MKPHPRRWPLFPKEGVLDSTCGDDRHDSATHYLKWKIFQKRVSQKQHVEMKGMTQPPVILNKSSLLNLIFNYLFKKMNYLQRILWLETDLTLTLTDFGWDWLKYCRCTAVPTLDAMHGLWANEHNRKI